MSGSVWVTCVKQPELNTEDTFDLLVAEHRALLSLHDVQGVELVVSAVGQRQGAPRRQLLLSGVNIGL